VLAQYLAAVRTAALGSVEGTQLPAHPPGGGPVLSGHDSGRAPGCTVFGHRAFLASAVEEMFPLRYGVRSRGFHPIC